MKRRYTILRVFAISSGIIEQRQSLYLFTMNRSASHKLRSLIDYLESGLAQMISP